MGLGESRQVKGHAWLVGYRAGYLLFILLEPLMDCKMQIVQFYVG